MRNDTCPYSLNQSAAENIPLPTYTVNTQAVFSAGKHLCFKHYAEMLIYYLCLDHENRKYAFNISKDMSKHIT